MALAGSLAFAQENTRETYVIDGSQTLYIIDGVVSLKTAADELPNDAIKNINIIKGVDKVVMITTKNGRVVSGRVIDNEGKPIMGVAVLSEKTHNGVVTDKDGRFKINLPAGEAFLKFAMIDYPTKTVQVDKTDLGDIVLEKGGSQNTIVIRARGEKMPTGDPLVIFKKPDGKLSKGNLDSVKPDQIKSIHVLKDNSVDAYKQYGDTSNGVILVELK